MRFRRSLAAVAVAALAAPAAASAHANLVRVRPANGVVLTTPPAAVRVLFDDAIRPGPGVEAVRNGGGSVLAGAAYVPRRNPRELVVPLRRGLAKGSYSVRWSVVSDDGHNERGVTAFAVGAGAARPTATLTAGGVGRSRDVAFRLLLFAGILAAAGAALFRALVWRPVAGRLADRELSLVVLAGCLLAVVGAAGLAAHGTAGIRFGLAERILAAVAASGAVLAAVSLRERRLAGAAGLVAVALIPLPALAGHALDANQPWWSAPVDALHVAGASVWVGGLLSLAVGVPRAVKELERIARARLLAAAASRFSTLALASVAAIAATGLVRALGELTAVSQAWSTSYGRTLLVKTGLLGMLVLLGVRNRYRLVPRLREASSGNPAGLRAFRRLRRSLAAELALLTVLVGAVALLTELPPGRNARAAQAPKKAEATRPAVLPPPGGVVLARQDGDRAVALSARRANERLSLVATVLGPNGFGLEGLTVGFATPGGPGAEGQSCGSGCYEGSLSAPSARAVDVVVSGRRMRFRLPKVWPTRDAAPLLGRAAGVFRSLRSLVIDERLASSPTYRVRTRFEIVAPDRLAYRISSGVQAIVVGGRRWDRTGTGPWRASPQSPLRLPAPPWSRVRDARVLRRGVDRGRPVWAIAFLDPTIPAWFEAQVDRRTLRTLDVRMTAAAHFMHDRYSGFDAPLRISPPHKP
ncbi:MAG TPA: CopD family protein [Gaiellaceae bacterium]|nr:CopD family protein [Gaiellaceae bacterium]